MVETVLFQCFSGSLYSWIPFPSLDLCVSIDGVAFIYTSVLLPEIYLTVKFSYNPI